MTFNTGKKQHGRKYCNEQKYMNKWKEMEIRKEIKI